MQKITPFLWFDSQAEEAVNFYVSVFKNAKAGKVMRCGDGGPGPKGSVLTVSFELEGIEFIALNGGPHFKLNEAVSFVIHCADQAETDHYWNKLVEGGGEHSQCGWLKDRFGLSWQVTPTILLQRMSDPDPAKAGRVAQAMMKMTKIDIAKIEEAYKG
ncbi:VOC family protein [Bosea sp. BK604]|uniref:VOC family protein n=1 Tax=Bosea sp. BK604 TaxID=2512180 RepID=UPI00104E7331|nr:VOC family protein [Bosea sp. BK604]TCR62196.1 putative 3-demethylubiquinone-9 3-methyltransferase (glyoxalase superfamily) [Bosea sp. BK604]